MLEEAMRAALALAEEALEAGETPVGAVVVLDGRIIAAARNERLTPDPTAHAEILALRRAAAALGRANLRGCTLVTTLEPCPMCAAAAVHAQVSAIVFGAFDFDHGGCGGLCHLPADPRFGPPIPVTGGLLREASESLLSRFFHVLRK